MGITTGRPWRTTMMRPGRAVFIARASGLTATSIILSGPEPNRPPDPEGVPRLVLRASRLKTKPACDIRLLTHSKCAKKSECDPAHGRAEGHGCPRQLRILCQRPGHPAHLIGHAGLNRENHVQPPPGASGKFRGRTKPARLARMLWTYGRSDPSVSFPITLRVSGMTPDACRPADYFGFFAPFAFAASRLSCSRPPRRMFTIE